MQKHEQCLLLEVCTSNSSAHRAIKTLLVIPQNSGALTQEFLNCSQTTHKFCLNNQRLSIFDGEIYSNYTE